MELPNDPLPDPDEDGPLRVSDSPTARAAATRALAFFDRACDGGVPSSCSAAEQIWKKGIFVDQDLAKAASLRDRADRGRSALAHADARACASGQGVACERLARRYQGGEGDGARGIDLPAAAAWYGQACAIGGWMGCVELGRMLEDGKPTPRDLARAASLYSAACNAGELAGCSWLGLAFAWGSGVPKDEQLSAALYRRACDGGEPRGCWLLGERLSRGTGIPKDRQAAALVLQKSCALGELSGCQALRRMRDSD